MTVDLVEFLEQRLSEDEVAAKAASEGGLSHFSHWEVGRSSVHAGLSTVKDVGRAAVDAEATTREYATHSARWDPARVLAECVAKRALLDLHSQGIEEDPAGTPYSTGCDECSPDWPMPGYGQPWPCMTLRLIAEPFASHPDYPMERTP